MSDQESDAADSSPRRSRRARLAAAFLLLALSTALVSCHSVNATPSPNSAPLVISTRVTLGDYSSRERIHDEIGIRLLTVLSARSSHLATDAGARRPIVLSSPHLYEVLGEEPVGTVIPVTHYLRTSVEPLTRSGKGNWQVKVWLEDLSEATSVPENVTTRTATPTTVSREFAFAVRDLLRYDLDVGTTEDTSAIVERFARFEWSHHREVTATKLNRVLARHLGKPDESEILVRAEARIDRLLAETTESSDALFEKYSLVTRRARLAYGNDAKLESEKRNLRARLDAVEEEPGALELVVATKLARGYETVFDYSKPLGQAWRPFEEALEHDDRLAEPYYFRAYRLLRELENGRATATPARIQRILEDLDKAVLLNPGHLRARAHRARVLALVDRWDEAETALDEAASIRPDTPFLLYQSVIVKWWERDYLAGKLELDPSNAAHLDRVSVLDDDLAALLPRLAASGIYGRSVNRIAVPVYLAHGDFASAEKALIQTLVTVDPGIRARYMSALATPDEEKELNSIRREVSPRQGDHSSMETRMLLALLDARTGRVEKARSNAADVVEASGGSGTRSAQAAAALATAATVHHLIGLPEDAHRYANQVRGVHTRPQLQTAEDAGVALVVN